MVRSVIVENGRFYIEAVSSFVLNSKQCKN